MPKITPFLWFDGAADEAADFYVSVFDDGEFLGRMPGPDGKSLTVNLTLHGQELVFLNGGQQYQLSEAFSLAIECDGQAEVDRYWDALLAGGGQPHACGWLKDRFGVSWQVVPKQMLDLFQDPNPERAGRAMQAMMQMVKIDLAELESAADAA